jgi:hypothetical protein
MHYILGRHNVDDVEAWKRTIETDRQQHLAMGLHFEEVWSNVDNPREIFFIFEVDNLDQARAGLKAAGALDPDKQARGEIPQLFFLSNR